MNFSYSFGLVSYILSLFVLGLYPKVRILPVRFDTSFLFHFSAFFLLYLFLLDRFKKKMSSFFIAVVIAGLIELLQRFLPSRTPSLFDFLYDLSGIAAALIVGFRGKETVFKILYSFAFLGYIPLGPGTLSSLTFTLLIYLSQSFKKIYVWQIFMILLPVAVIASQKAEDLLGNDPAICVIDEVVGMVFPLMFLEHDILLYVLAFLFFRFFDILKPFGIKRVDKIKGGIGIVLDDLLAGLFALIAVKMVIVILSQAGVNL
ncbi:MAG: phosphatidylglycerophosphatase A [bacterium]|nr:phosphatidylglycerophosphatase A [bacterium]